jgi:hypothetical protein
MELLPIVGLSVRTGMRPTAWVRENFGYQQLNSSEPSQKPFDGFDKILLLSWVVEQFSGAKQPFVLHYWDLRMPNIIVDDNYNIKA